MNEFTFEATPWLLALEELAEGSDISAVRFLTLLEEAGEAEVEDALLDLEERHITLDISELPKVNGTG